MCSSVSLLSAGDCREQADGCSRTRRQLATTSGARRQRGRRRGRCANERDGRRPARRVRRATRQHGLPAAAASARAAATTRWRVRRGRSGAAKLGRCARRARRNRFRARRRSRATHHLAAAILPSTSQRWPASGRAGRRGERSRRRRHFARKHARSGGAECKRHAIEASEYKRLFQLLAFPAPYPFPQPPSYAGLSDIELAAMEGRERAAIEARLDALRNISTLLDAASLQFRQYVASAPSTAL